MEGPKQPMRWAPLVEVGRRLSRRSFVKLSAIGVAGAGCAALGGKSGGKTQARGAGETAPVENGVLVVVDDVVESRQDDYGVILLKDEEERLLPIWVGRFEAQSIRIGLNAIPTPRPMTYDFVRNILHATGAKPVRVRITQLREMTFYATLLIHVGAEEQILDCRPSDAIAIAVRTRTPIYVEKEVMDSQSITKDDLEGLEPPVWA
jgi:bifunctional DNase/RNase